MEHQHACAWYAGKKSFHRLAVRWTVATATAHRRAHHERHLDRVVVHERKLGRVIDPLIGGEREEVAEHDLDHRTMTGQRQAVAHADNRGLADRCVPYPSRKTLTQIARALECSTVWTF